MLIKNSKPKCVWKNRSLLGEGTLWVPTLNSIFFVDIKEKKIFILNTKTKKRKVFKVNKEIGFISHIKENVFILGLKSELRIINLINKKVLYSIKIESNKKYNRLNDGKTDPMGRLWFGTMDNLERKKSSGSLYCLNNKLKLHKVDSKYYITNGPAFLNKNNFYHTDTRKKIIYKIRINNKLKILKKSVFLKFRRIDGFPDGMSTDAKNITNCTFGGPKNNELYISTARKDLKIGDIKKYPLSGSLFKTRINIKGKDTQSFKLSS